MGSIADLSSFSESCQRLALLARFCSPLQALPLGLWQLVRSTPYATSTTACHRPCPLAFRSHTHTLSLALVRFTMLSVVPLIATLALSGVQTLGAPVAQAATTLNPGQNAPPRQRTACGDNSGTVWTCNRWDAAETYCLNGRFEAGGGWLSSPCGDGTLCLNVVST